MTSLNQTSNILNTNNLIQNQDSIEQTERSSSVWRNHKVQILTGLALFAGGVALAALAATGFGAIGIAGVLATKVLISSGVAMAALGAVLSSYHAIKSLVTRAKPPEPTHIENLHGQEEVEEGSVNIPYAEEGALAAPSDELATPSEAVKTPDFGKPTVQPWYKEGKAIGAFAATVIASALVYRYLSSGNDQTPPRAGRSVNNPFNEQSSLDKCFQNKLDLDYSQHLNSLKNENTVRLVNNPFNEQSSLDKCFQNKLDLDYSLHLNSLKIETPKTPDEAALWHAEKLAAASAKNAALDAARTELDADACKEFGIC